MLGYHVELHTRPNLLTLQCSVSCGKISNLWQAASYTLEGWGHLPIP